MFQSITPAVKNLLIINVLLYLLAVVMRSSMGIDLDAWFGLHYFQSNYFAPWQFITFMFMHGSFWHVFCNMFAVYMFGRTIEQVWGTPKFLIYYFVTGIGSGIVQQVALYFDIAPFIEAVDAYLSNQTTESLQNFIDEHGAFSQASVYAMSTFTSKYNALAATSMTEANAYAREFIMEYQQLFIDAHNTIGASGAVFGLLLAFGMLFPNMVIWLMFPPIPLKAKYFVLGYGLLEFFSGIANTQYDNVAHWAHLGGMLFGFFLIRKWKEKSLY